MRAIRSGAEATIFSERFDSSCAYRTHRKSQEEPSIMNKLAVSLIAGAAALVAGSSAQAAPLSPTAPVVDNGIEQVRTVCDRFGRCWRERGQRRVIIGRDSYNDYGPRHRYRERYRDRSGIHFNAPGVSVGIGGGRDRW
jgi:hypothetical protein